MPYGFYGARDLSSLTDFSARDRELAEKAAAQQEGRRRKALESRGNRLDELSETARRQLYDLLGARKSAELRDGIRRERLALRDLGQPPEGLERDYAKQRKASRRKVDTLVRKLGVDADKVRRIADRFHAGVDALRSDGDGKVVPGYDLPRHLAKWVDLSPLHVHPLPWGVLPPPDDPNDPNRWFLFRPPFFGFLFSFAPQATSAFVVDRLLFLDPSVGLVGNEATMDCTDPGDFGAASATAESQIAVPFVPPVAGVLEVLVDAQSTFATHHVEIDDDFGFSSAWAYQNNYLMMNVLHPNVVEPSLALMSTAGVDTDGDDETLDQQNLTRGQHYFAHLFSAGPVPAGQTVVVTVGTRSFDIAHANDMDLHSRSNFQWFINSVEVRVAP